MTSDDKDRKARLAQALRANLRRRKAQARDAAREAPDDEADETEVSRTGKPAETR